MQHLSGVVGGVLERSWFKSYHPWQLAKTGEMSKVCLIVIDGWGISDASKGSMYVCMPLFVC